MFGENTIVGQKHFPERGGKLLVVGVFKTIQGEGMYSGCPAIFVRLAKCNLACSFCDTFFDAGKWVEVDALYKKAGRLAKGKQRNYVLVITGGEPMLQPSLVDFIEMQRDDWRAVQIESNGILLQPLPDSTTLVVSPKCLEKEGKPHSYIKPPEKSLTRADGLKFVMSAKVTSPYSSVPGWAARWQKKTGKDVFVSPMAIYKRKPNNEIASFWNDSLMDSEANRRNHEHTAQYALKNGYRFQVQAHLYGGVA